MSTSPYHAFRSALPDGQAEVYEPAFIDGDGVTLFEGPYRELLLTIVKLDDVANLRRYIAATTDLGVLGPCETPWDDPFCEAAINGSKDALEVLLEYWRSIDGPRRTELVAPNARGFGLLHTACNCAQIETVLLLLSDPWRAEFGNVVEKDDFGWTPLLSVVGQSSAGSGYSVRAYVTRSEKIVRLLLQHGASASETCIRQGVVCETVLSVAMPWASSALVKLLIDEGADANARTRHEFIDIGTAYRPRPDCVEGVTTMHIASLYANLGGLQVLLELDTSLDLIQETDSQGRHCLHWAAIGPHGDNYMLEDTEVIPSIIATIELLLSTNHGANALNTRDSRGDTPLHYAARRTAGPSGKIGLAIARVLCEHGADASIRGRYGETPLHSLGCHMQQIDPIDTALVDLLLAHGASVDDTDELGNTILHLTARYTGHIDMARHLLGKGCNARATNEKGDTPLHEAAAGRLCAYSRAGNKAFLEINAAKRTKAQGEMLRVLVEGLPAEEAEKQLNRLNKDGKTPRRICQEMQQKWRQEDEERHNRAMGRGRGRGRG